MISFSLIVVDSQKNQFHLGLFMAAFRRPTKPEERTLLVCLQIDVRLQIHHAENILRMIVLGADGVLQLLQMTLFVAIASVPSLRGGQPDLRGMDSRIIRRRRLPDIVRIAPPSHGEILALFSVIFPIVITCIISETAGPFKPSLGLLDLAVRGI